MVVISGKYRGRHLKALPGMATRPMSARVKEDLFNILNNYFVFDDKRSLDLFAGSGALSVEALSRGVRHAYISDQSPAALKIVRDNLQGLPTDSYTLLNLDYQQMLKDLVVRRAQVDLIFLDPPFARLDYYYDFFATILNFRILRQWGIIITQSNQPLDLTRVTGLVLLKMKDYKNKFLYLFRLESESGHE